MLTHRRAVDRVRKEQGHPRPIATVPDVTDDLDLQKQAQRNLLGRRATDLLRELPEAQRRCLALAYRGGNTMTEIAALTGVPTGTVKTRCRAALRKLRNSPRNKTSPLTSPGDSSWPVGYVPKHHTTRQ